MAFLTQISRAIIRAGGASLPRYFNAEEVKSILNAVKDNRSLHLLIHFLWKTGVRASEAINVRFGDIDPYQKTLRVVTLKKDRHKKPGRKRLRKHERIIPLPDDLTAELIIYGNERGLKYEDLIFPFTRSTLFRKVKKACFKANIWDERAHPHTFRHSFAIHLIKNRVPITVVQRLLGHSSIENTAIYLAVIQQEAEVFVREVEW